MKNKVFYLVALAVGMVFVMSGCKDDECFDETNPECSNFDPCFGKYPDKLEIEMYCWNLLIEPYSRFDFHITEDSIFLSPITFKFKTNHKYDSVKWHISGSSQTWTTNELQLNFNSGNNLLNPLIGDFSVVSLGYRVKDQMCKGGSDSGIDTISRNFRLLEWWNPKIAGHYRGLNDGEKDSVEFILYFDSFYNTSNEIYYNGDSWAYGLLPKSYENEHAYNAEFDVYMGYNKFRKNRDAINITPPIFGNVKGYLINDDEIIVEWETRPLFGSQKRKFKGKRIKK